MEKIYFRNDERKLVEVKFQLHLSMKYHTYTDNV